MCATSRDTLAPQGSEPVDKGWLLSRFPAATRSPLAPQSAGMADESPSPEIARVELAIARLPKRTRDAFLMHRLDSLSFAEIARRLNIGLQAVEGHVADALYAIREAREAFASLRGESSPQAKLGGDGLCPERSRSR